jgi:acyl-CoA synthetase (NDP forming)
VEKAWDEIQKNIKKQYPDAKIQGISVQKMARTGVEIIIGVSKDPQFGPVIMFGLGGIMVEILKDVSFRIVPLARRDAHEMIREIKGYPVLEGYRGQEPVDIGNLEEFIMKVSAFAEKHPEVEELDLNPVFAYKDGAVAVDARIILGEDK